MKWRSFVFISEFIHRTYYLHEDVHSHTTVIHKLCARLSPKCAAQFSEYICVLDLHYTGYRISSVSLNSNTHLKWVTKQQSVRITDVTVTTYLPNTLPQVQVAWVIIHFAIYSSHLHLVCASLSFYMLQIIKLSFICLKDTTHTRPITLCIVLSVA